MSQTELVFRGLSSDECRTFIREVHQQAHAAGRFRNNAWMADAAMSAFDGDALELFDEVDPEIQGDWTLLRRELLRRYCSNKSNIVPVAARAEQQTMQNALAAVTHPISDNFPSISDVFRTRIKVVAPNANYVGYISGFENTKFGQSCMLTRNPTEAIAIAAPLSDIFNLDVIEFEKDQPEPVSKGYIAPIPARITESETDSTAFVLGLWLRQAAFNESGSVHDRFSPIKDDTPVSKTSGSQWVNAPYTWKVADSRKLTPVVERKATVNQIDQTNTVRANNFSKSCKLKCCNPPLPPIFQVSTSTDVWPEMRTGLVKSSNSGLTVFFWKSQSWDQDGSYSADLYLERFFT